MERREVKMSAALTEDVASKVREYAQKRGCSYSSAMAELIEIALTHQGTLDSLNRHIEAGNKVLIEALEEKTKKQIEAQQKQLDRIGKDLSIIKKNERYGDRAALGLLAWASWISQYLDLMMDSAKCDEQLYDNGEAMFRVGITKTHKIFWDAGGMLCRDPEAILHSFLKMGDIVGDEEMEKIVKMSSKEWRNFVSYTDSEAISKLADKTNKKGE